jgi:hypothetical protein
MLVNLAWGFVCGASRGLRDDQGERYSQDERGKNGDYNEVPAAESRVRTGFDRNNVPGIGIPMLHNFSSQLACH